MAMENDSFSSKNETDQIGDWTEASSVTQPRGEGEDSMFSDDVAGKEYPSLVDSGSSSVLGSPGIISDEKKQIVQSLGMKPIVLKKTKVIKLLGVDIHVSTDFENTVSYNPTPLCCFNPNTVQFVPAVHSNDPLDQRGAHVENTEPKPQLPDDFSRLLQNIEARIGAKPVLLYKKKLTISDVSPNLNRLFITKNEELMGFLRDEERRRVENDDKKVRLDVLATDLTGEMYELHLKLWPSLNIVVLNGRDWKAVVSRNNSVAGYLVELWAYREQDTELRLAVNFKEDELKNNRRD